MKGFYLPLCSIVLRTFSLSSVDIFSTNVWFISSFIVHVCLTTVVLAEIRTEAVMQALAAHSKKIPVMPLPSKRTSVNYHGQQRHRDSRQGLYSLPAVTFKNLYCQKFGGILVCILYSVFCILIIHQHWNNHVLFNPKF